jgi:type IV pilus assembly protein PilA
MARLVRRAKQYGFTLVELLIVVAIIGVLSTVGIPSFRRMVQKSKKSEAKVNLGGLYTAEQAFFSEYGGYGNYLSRLGFNVDGNPANLMYVIGFTGANCASTVTNAGSTRPQNAAADPIGLAIAQAFPQYYVGPYLARPAPNAATGNVDPGASSLGNGVMTAGCGTVPPVTAATFGPGATNNVYNFGTAGGQNNRFVAMAHGVIAPGISKAAPANADVDVWGINQDRVLINVQDGVR